MAKEGSVVRKGDYEYQTRGGKSYNFNVVKPAEKKKAPAKPKPKKQDTPAPVIPKPKPNYKGDEQRFRPAPPPASATPFKPPKRPVTPTPKPVTAAEAEMRRMTSPGLESIRSPSEAVTYPLRVMGELGKRFGRKFMSGDVGEGITTGNAMKDGGKVRGDGMSRVKTKGRCL